LAPPPKRNARRAKYSSRGGAGVGIACPRDTSGRAVNNVSRYEPESGPISDDPMPKYLPNAMTANKPKVMQKAKIIADSRVETIFLLPTDFGNIHPGFVIFLILLNHFNLSRQIPLKSWKKRN
jgi:hypothetical protein